MAQEVPVPATRPLLVATIVAGAFFMETLDSTVIVTALPRMAESFGRNPVDLSLGITVYMLTLAVCIPASGWMADRFGTRTVFCSAIGVFMAASIACGFTTDLWSFVAARIVQGLGGAMMSPVGRLAVLRTTEKKDLVRSMNFLIFPGLIGPIIGPPVGGFITTFLSWRWIFFLNFPIGLIGIALVYRFMQNHFAEKVRPFDGLGFVLNGGALACVMYGLDLLGGGKAEGPVGAGVILAGVVLAVFAVRHARSSPHPLVSIAPFRRRSFTVTNSGGAVYRFATGAPNFLMPLLFQIGLGMTPFLSGLMILGHASGDMAAKAITTRTIRYFGFRSVLIWAAVGYAILIAACALFTATTPFWIMIVLLFASGAIRSIKLSALSSLQFADLPTSEMSAASTLSSVIQQSTRGVGVACAAGLLNLLVALRGAEAGALSLSDFHIAFVATGVVALASIFWYLRLDPSTGSEVSGHRR